MIQLHLIEKDSIVCDPKEAGKQLTRYFRQSKRPLRLMGMGDTDDFTLTLFLENTNHRELDRTFVFSPFPGNTVDEVAATVQHRYAAGFDTLGTFYVEENLWGLFSIADEDRK